MHENQFILDSLWVKSEISSRQTHQCLVEAHIKLWSRNHTCTLHSRMKPRIHSGLKCGPIEILPIWLWRGVVIGTGYCLWLPPLRPSFQPPNLSSKRCSYRQATGNVVYHNHNNFIIYITYTSERASYMRYFYEIVIYEKFLFNLPRGINLFLFL